MNEKMNEIIKNYVEISTSTEESENEDDDETSEEDSMSHLKHNRDLLFTVVCHVFCFDCIVFLVCL